MTIFFRVSHLVLFAVFFIYECANFVPVYDLCPVVEAKLRFASLVDVFLSLFSNEIRRSVNASSSFQLVRKWYRSCKIGKLRILKFT